MKNSNIQQGNVFRVKDMEAPMFLFAWTSTVEGDVDKAVFLSEYHWTRFGGGIIPLHQTINAEGAEIEPIPLTDDGMMRLGFKQFQVCSSITAWIVQTDLQINNTYLFNIKSFTAEDKHEVKYLHDLQNEFERVHGVPLNVNPLISL